MKIIGIAGGSGAGKSTISYKLVDSYPEIFEVLNLDDYQKLKTSSNLPMVEDMINWDHPDIILWDELLKDIETLKSGKSVEIQTWSHRSNPDYHKHGKMIPRKIYSKKKLIVEGYLSLWKEELRSQYLRRHYLDLHYSERMKRRNKFIDPKYIKRVLIPMHKKYVEPTKKYADQIYDVSSLDEDQVFERIKSDLSKEGSVQL